MNIQIVRRKKIKFIDLRQERADKGAFLFLF